MAFHVVFVAISLYFLNHSNVFYPEKMVIGPRLLKTDMNFSQIGN